jgi:ATP-binding cassette, subfamily B, bacterial
MNRRFLRKIVPYVRRFMGLYLLGVLLAGVLFYCIPLVPGLLLKWALDAILLENPSMVIAIALALVGAEVARIVQLAISNFLIAKVSYGVAMGVRLRVLMRILASRDRLPTSAGAVLNRLSQDALTIGRFVISTYGPIGQVVSLAIALGVLASVDLRTTVAVAVPLALVAVVVRSLGGWVKRTRAKERNATDRVAEWLTDVFVGILTIKMSGARRVISRLDRLSERRALAARLSAVATSILESAFDASSYWATCGILIFAIPLFVDGAGSVGDVALFVSYVGWISKILSGTASFLAQAKAAEIAADRLGLLEVSDGVESKVGEELCALPTSLSPLPVTDTLRKLEVRCLSVEIGSIRLLKALSFEVSAGELVVVTGRIGAGKSTLVRTLAGLEKVVEGSVAWNGQAIRLGSPATKPPRMAFLLPQAFVFRASIGENVLLDIGCEEDAEQALRLAEFDPRREGMPKGLATLVGTDGAQLSGGQRRRLLLARALAKPAEVYVLDEPTSELDAETEIRIMDRLKEGRITGVIASSSPHVISRADRVVLLDKGSVVGVGSVAELDARSSAFRSIYNGP